MKATIGQLIEWSARNYPDKIGLVDLEKGQRWTFAEWDRDVNKMANLLRQLGVSKGDVVSVFLYNTSEFVTTLFAVAKIGAIFNPINYRLTAGELQFILSDAQSKVLVFEERVRDVVTRTRELGVPVQHYLYANENAPAYAQNLSSLLAGVPDDRHDAVVSETDPYIMMYTSGTTGRPKGVIHPHRNMITHNFIMLECMGITRNDVGLSVAPLNHTAELHTSFLPRVQIGATNLLLPMFDPEQVLKVIEQERVTHLFAAPTMVNMLLNASGLEKYDLSSLRMLGYGGASMAPALIRRFKEKVGADLVQMYGTTEMGPVMSVLYADEQLAKAGSAGKAVMNHELRVVRPEPDGSPSRPDNLCEVGEPGEIIVRGPCMMLEYYNRPDATEKALAYGWYHTGDVGVIDEDGYLWIRDRMDHTIISGAENIYPREVEDCLIEHPGVLEAAVVGKPDEKWGEIVVAFVVRQPGSQVTAEELDRFLLEGDKLARYKRPREYHFVDSLPKTASGKLQKFVLEQQLKEQANQRLGG